MRDRDIHLSTGKYDPMSYWDARARHSGDNDFKAVCAYRLSDAANAAMEYIQRHMLADALSDIDLAGRPVLEFGCGVGRWMPFMTGRGANYAGADISDEMLKVARSRYPGPSWTTLVDHVLPFEDWAFDLVFSVTVLHHNPHTTQKAIIAELGRVLRPGGHLILMEAICVRDDDRPSFNMFPRTIHSWVETVEQAAQIEFKRARYARWWILADLLKRLPIVGRGFMRPGHHRQQAQRPDREIKWALRLAAFDKFMLPFLPRRLSTNATMVFRKPD